LRSAAALVLALGALALGAPAAVAAGPPTVGASWSFAVQADSARLQAQITPNGLTTSYHFDYITDAAYQKNLGEAKDGFAGGSKIPPATDTGIGSGNSSVTPPPQQLSGLTPDTLYRYRVAAKNSATSPNYVLGAVHTFRTPALGGGGLLPDSRGWELVSPVEKNGGLIEGPGQIAGGGVLQASGDGATVTYGSSASFAGGGQGAPPASQYIGRRTSSGWSAENITVPVFSGSYDALTEGVPYQIFSPDLASTLLFNGEHCRGGGSGCGVANPPLAGTDAPSGFQNYYLRQTSPVGFDALLGPGDLSRTPLKAANFDVRIAGASTDLAHVILTSCAALTATAIEVPLGESCDPAEQNLYEWSAAGGLSLVNSTPGASLAAQSGAISADGSRVYWVDSAGEIHLREGASDFTLGAGEFQVASATGAIAYFLDAGSHLRSYDTGSHTSTDLTPSDVVLGVLGASSAGDYVYYVTAAGISLRHGGTTTPIAASTDSGNYPPGTGTARVSADGQHLVFVSKASLTGYDNLDLGTGNPDAQVYLYDATGALPLTCVSCNPTNERPSGPSGIQGASANGTAPGSLQAYKSRVLSANGHRVYFESRDTLASSDTNSGAPDVYQWEAAGEGDCTRAEGCVRLISSGRSAGGATFVDASTDGSDIFFLTDASLVPTDPGSVDLYDARVSGGFPPPSPPLDCAGDACTPLPEEPIDPTLSTLTAGRGNPPRTYHNLNKKKKHHKAKHHKRKHTKGGRGR
jgi:hypothetical protein